MRYKNIITGAIIEVASVCNGENWELIKDKPAKAAPKTKPKKSKDVKADE
ncbi:MAG: hypothetical protein Q4C80_04155 [Bacillota bacterium]|nr:hypothetical protein [Bacillota bacterium]